MTIMNIIKLGISMLLATTLATSIIAQNYYDRWKPTSSTSSSNNNSFSKMGFDINHLFIGGTVGLGFSTYNTNIGATPEIGYTLVDWLDAGLAINLNYSSQRADPNYDNDIRTRKFNYGGGPFIRAYAFKSFFAQVQVESNWIRYHQTDFNVGYDYAPVTYTSTSFLVGAGYSQRVVGQINLYFCVLFDLNNDIYSPYRSYTISQVSGSNALFYSNGISIPIVRGGFNWYLHSRH